MFTCQKPQGEHQQEYQCKSQGLEASVRKSVCVFCHAWLNLRHMHVSPHVPGSFPHGLAKCFARRVDCSFYKMQVHKGKALPSESCCEQDQTSNLCGPKQDLGKIIQLLLTVPACSGKKYHVWLFHVLHLQVVKLGRPGRSITVPSSNMNLMPTNAC